MSVTKKKSEISHRTSVKEMSGVSRLREDLPKAVIIRYMSSSSPSVTVVFKVGYSTRLVVWLSSLMHIPSLQFLVPCTALVVQGSSDSTTS